MVMFKLCFTLFESGTVYPGCVTRNLSINFRGFKHCGQKGQFLIFEEKESVRSDSNLAPASVKNANASKPSHLFEPDVTSSPDLIKRSSKFSRKESSVSSDKAKKSSSKNMDQVLSPIQSVMTQASENFKNDSLRKEDFDNENNSSEDKSIRDPADIENNQDSEKDTVQPASSWKSQHTDPNWLENLKSDFSNLIVEKCSVLTRKAIEEDAQLSVMIIIKRNLFNILVILGI